MVKMKLFLKQAAFNICQVLLQIAVTISIIPSNIYRGQKYFNIALVLQDKRLTIFTHPANTCTCPLKAYAIKNIKGVI